MSNVKILVGLNEPDVMAPLETVVAGKDPWYSWTQSPTLLCLKAEERRVCRYSRFIIVWFQIMYQVVLIDFCRVVVVDVG